MDPRIGESCQSNRVLGLTSSCFSMQVCLAVRLFLCLSVSQPVRLSVRLSISLSACLSISLAACLPVWQPACLAVSNRRCEREVLGREPQTASVTHGQ